MAPEIIHFSEKRKKKSIGEGDNNQSASEPPSRKCTMTLDMRKTRMEVFKFGISGLDAQSKVDAKTAHAIKLGAKPPRSKFINYKELMEAKKKEKEEEIQQRINNDRYKLINPLKSKSTKGKKRKKDINDVGKLTCQPGVYRGGVQVIKKSKLLAR